MDTIFALSSGAPPAAIAIVRLSGPAAFDAVRALAGALPPPRQARLTLLRDGDDEPLDRALVLTFPAPASATGEDVAELHLHGGRSVVRAVERVLAAIPGLRAAEPGEFTRRALINGRIDLSEAEGLGDLLAAETEGQRRSAMRSAEGAVRRAVEGWTSELLQLSARAEALLDHSDEDDVEEDALPSLRADAQALADAIQRITSQPPVERLRDGLRVVLAGPPNAGKSTLFNVLAGRAAAIVSPIAGTTRDRIEAPVVRGGTAFVLVDTAGLAERTDDAVEAMGIGLAHEAIRDADIRLWLGDTPPVGDAIWIHSRCDEPGRGAPDASAIPVSAATGEGIEALWSLLAARAKDMLPPPDTMALNRRQRDLCEAASRALASAAGHDDALLFAEELRRARNALDAVTGRADVEAVLEALFARFCIGK